MNVTARMERAALVATAIAAHPGVSGRAWTPDTPRGRVAPVRVYCSQHGRRIGYIVIRGNGELVSSLDVLSGDLMALANAAVDDAARGSAAPQGGTVVLSEPLAAAADAGEFGWVPPVGPAPAELLEPVSKASNLYSGRRYRLVGGPHDGKVAIASPRGIRTVLRCDDGTEITVTERTARAGGAEWVFGACAA